MDILRQRSMRSLIELINLFSFSGVALGLPRVRLAGYHGWGALANTVGLLYLQQISSRDQVRLQAACLRAGEDRSISLRQHGAAIAGSRLLQMVRVGNSSQLVLCCCAGIAPSPLEQFGLLWREAAWLAAC